MIGSVAVVAALLLGSCKGGLTLRYDLLGDTTVRLRGEVKNTETGPTSYYFDYGTTTGYGSTTPVETVDVVASDQAVPVTAVVSGLAEGTEHHYRICVLDEGVPNCSLDHPVTTLSGRDTLTGSGWVVGGPGQPAAIGAEIQAVGVPGLHTFGEGTLLRVRPAPPGTLGEGGGILCVRVDGNRATAVVNVSGRNNPAFVRIHVEDNGPTGDRYGAVLVADSPDVGTCPVTTDADFVPIPTESGPVAPIVTNGDFQVHDHGVS